MRHLATFLLLLTGIPTLAADEAPLEPGFTALFTGKDLSGWQMAKGGEPLEGKTASATKRFVVRDGLLVIDPKVKGDLTINTTREFAGDAHLKFDFRPGPGCNNDLFFRGLKFDLKKPDVKNLKEGEWNAFEIVVTGDMAEFRCNGELLKTAKVKMPRSPLGIRAEFGPVELRRIRIKSGS